MYSTRNTIGGDDDYSISAGLPRPSDGRQYPRIVHHSGRHWILPFHEAARDEGPIAKGSQGDCRLEPGGGCQSWTQCRCSYNRPRSSAETAFWKVCWFIRD